MRCDKRRKTVYVVVKASDMPSGTKRLHAKPADWTDIFIAQCARELMAQVTTDGEIVAYLGGDDGPSPEKPCGDGESPEKSASGDGDKVSADPSVDGVCAEPASAGDEPLD